MKSFALGLTLLLSGICCAQQKAIAPPSPAKEVRYQLVSLEVDESPGGSSSAVYHEVFLLDVQTGEVWRYQPASLVKNADGTHQLVPEVLIPVGRSAYSMGNH
jgi:hypothetical protein